MKRFSPLATAAIVALVLTTAVPALGLPSPKEEWIEVRTANFTLFSSAGEKSTRRIGADLERLRGALAQLSPGLALQSPYPTYIFVFKNRYSLQPYQRLYEGKPLSSDGYFLSRNGGNYVAINGDPRGDQRGIVYHEYLHYVARNNYGDLPLWLNEGLAEFYSTFEVDGDQAKIGIPLPDHVAWLRGNELIPLAQLFAVDEQSKEYNESTRRGTFYAESWALVHYLLSSGPERRRQAGDYLLQAQGGAPGLQAFQQAFGADLAGLERELRTYVKSYNFNISRVTIQPEASLNMEVRSMARPDVLFRLGDLLANLDDDHHRAAAEEYFRTALEAQPNHGPSLAGLGELAELAGRPEEARSYYEKAAGLSPDDFRVQYLYAKSHLDGPEPRSLRKAREALSRVVALRSDFGEAWASLGYTYQEEEEITEEAVRILETARRLLPSRTDVAYNLAIVYARTGRKQQAEDLIEKVLVPRDKPGMIANAREAILNQDHRQAEDLIEQEKLEEALPILEQVRDRTSDPEKRRTLELRIYEVRRALDFNRFVDRYNEAVTLANKGDVKGAVAILEPLAETTQDFAQAERARSLLEQLKEPEKPRTRSRPR